MEWVSQLWIAKSGYTPQNLLEDSSKAEICGVVFFFCVAVGNIKFK